MRRRTSHAGLVAVLSVALLFGGCTQSSQQQAQDFSNVVGTVLSIAQADAGVVPAQDQAVYTSFVNLGITLHTQLNTCISASGASGAKATFLACFNTFAGGLISPAELAQLRLLSAGTQSKAQLIVTAIITGVDIALTAFGGTPAPTPAISATPTTAAELHDFAIRAGYAGYGR
jgi:hypothetical protein